MNQDEKSHIEHFLSCTKNRLEILESKVVKSRSEELEISACRGDIKRAEAALGIPPSKDMSTLIDLCLSNFKGNFLEAVEKCRADIEGYRESDNSKVFALLMSKGKKGQV